MTRIVDIALKQPISETNAVAAPEKELHVGQVRDLYRYHKLSEWFFDLLFRVLLNFGDWVTGLALGLKAGYGTFHGRRRDFAEDGKMRPPVYISDAEASRYLEELERKVTVIVR
jgi:hypothetical protein